MVDIITEAELAGYLQLADGAVPNDAIVVTLANGLVTEVVGKYDAAGDVPARVKAITLEVAARGWRNPQAYTSVTVGIDDYDKTVRREGKGADKVGVYLTDEERAELGDYAGVLRRRVGSFRVQVPDVS